MKPFFYIGLIGLAIFELLKVYLIMPMPGSQDMNSISVAYFLHDNRWIFRVVFSLMVLVGAYYAFSGKRKWIPALALIPVIVIVYFFNFQMTADRIFVQPGTVAFKGRADNQINDSTLLIAVEREGEAKAYPIRFILYHHQVRDTLAGKPIMVTYCNVCRTGRVFEPVVDGKTEDFRLVGMDHFNAMFEDATTKSWWRQATGEAITGSRKGNTLPEVPSVQVTANKFFTLYPFGKIMQPDEDFWGAYDSLGRFEKGRTKGDLTRRDTVAWKNKSWVVGLQTAKNARAYDWYDVMALQVINDKIGETPIVLALSSDGQSFVAFERTAEDEKFSLRNDSLVSDLGRYDFSGKDTNGNRLKRVDAYQEFWHSWKNFHPQTDQYRKTN
jgi:hypothetical protein